MARGDEHAGSDVDVGLLYEKTPASTLAARPFYAAAELESLIGRPVDLIVLNDAPADLVHRVLRDGVQVVEADRRARIAFEVRARNDHFDADVVAKKLALIETCVRELETLADPARIEVDLREERFVEHTLQIAVQAALDVASHIVSDDRLGEPRNILVHGYASVDKAIVRDVLVNHLGDLTAFVAAIRTRLET